MIQETLLGKKNHRAGWPHIFLLCCQGTQEEEPAQGPSSRDSVLGSGSVVLLEREGWGIVSSSSHTPCGVGCLWKGHGSGTQKS